MRIRVKDESSVSSREDIGAKIRHIKFNRVLRNHFFYATSTFALPTFPPFDAHADGNTGQRWKKWLGCFERLLIKMNIEEKKQQRAMLLHFAGPAVDEIFDTLPDTGEAKDYDKAVEALNAYFIPQINSLRRIQLPSSEAA